MDSSSSAYLYEHTLKVSHSPISGRVLVLNDPPARHPAVDLEDPSLVGLLYRTFLGGAETVPEASRALPASPALKMRLINLLTRSVVRRCKLKLVDTRVENAPGVST